MSNEPESSPQLFGHIDVTSQASAETAADGSAPGAHVVQLLSQIATSQKRQNELLEELIKQTNAVQRQRANELSQWKRANPVLAENCREAAETLGQAQTEFLKTIAEEVSDNGECLVDGEFMLNEFVDRFGPRLAHLNGVLQVLSQLGNAPGPPKS